MSKDDNARYRFGVRLLVKHRKIDLSYLTKALGMEPDTLWLAGARRTSPRGEIISGVYRDSVWSHAIEINGKRAFFSELNKFVRKLTRHKSALRRTTRTGGKVELIVELPGGVNIGDSISWESMKTLSALCIDLGIEVFPEFGDEINR